MSRLGQGVAILAFSALGFASAGAIAEDAPKDVQKEINEVKSVLPKFAIPMREVGDRFQNMHFAAKGGNWALAAYMSKYMNGEMSPASITKPDEYKAWKAFYESTFAPVNNAIQAKNIDVFETAYNGMIENCNGCHAGMGYGFIKVIKLGAPADSGMDYKVKSEPGDVPK